MQIHGSRATAFIALGLALFSAPLRAGEPGPTPESSLALRVYDWGPAGRRLLASTAVPLTGGAGRLRLSQEDEDPSPLSEIELSFRTTPGGAATVALVGAAGAPAPPLTLDDGERALRIELDSEGKDPTLSASPDPARLASPAPGTWEVEILDPGT